MAIKLGNTTPSKLYLGNTEINKAYLGNALVWDTGAAPSFLLDTYPGAAAAFSLRKLRTGQTNMLRVRRSSDSVETDVLFDSTYESLNLNSPVSAGSTLTSFISSNNGFLPKFYDQSGNGNDMVNTTAINQGTVVNAGALITHNGKPVIDRSFIPITDYLTTPITPLTVIAVAKINEFKTVNYIVGQPSAGYFYGGIYGGVNGLGGFDGTNIRSTTGEDTNEHLGVFILTGGRLYLYKDGASAIDLGTFTPFQVTTIFGRPNRGAGEGINGYVKEIIMYTTDQTANISGIMANINSYYGIY